MCLSIFSVNTLNSFGFFFLLVDSTPDVESLKRDIYIRDRVRIRRGSQQ